MDWGYLGITVAFFAVSLGLVNLCASLGGAK